VRNALRYNAAAAAARAGPERGWRKQAIQWLRADLASWEAVLIDGQPEGRRLLRSMLTHWKRDPDLASLRDEQGRLTASEQTDCAAIWKGVDALLARERETE
jgi:hypothetical protein